MGNEFRYVCLVETRRLLLLMGVVFGMVLFVQYFELPYSNVLSSLFATGKSRALLLDNYPSRNSSSNPTTLRNPTYFSSINSTNLDVANSTIKDSSGKDSDTTNNFENFKNPDDALNDDIDPEDESASKDLLEMDHNSTSFPLEKSRETHHESLDRNGAGKITPTPERNEDEFSEQETPSIAKSPLDLLSPSASPVNPEASSGTYTETSSPITSLENDAKIWQINENPKIMKAGRSAPVTDFTEKKGFEEPEPAVIPISKMNDMLLQSRVSHTAMKTRWSSKADQELLNMKHLIENAPIIEKDPQFDVNLYRNFSTFKRSYELMEQNLKVYIYAEGERPIFHQPPLKGIYASEGWFMKLLKANKRFVTKNPKKAHLFYLPFSSRMLEVTLYVPDSHNRKNLIETLSNYIETITTKHNFWNRTSGADHFLVACHDWAPSETREIMANCIRAMCNSDVKEGFNFDKDVSLAETFVRSPQNPLRQLGGKPPSGRRMLAFFAGNMHGYLRPILLKHWENKDPDMKIFGRIRKAKGQMSYAQYMKSSKYCVCAKGFEVNSPRVVEAIFYECVPVIISDNFVPPFFETLNWESFAVFVLEKDIPNLKNILLSIPKKRYLEMQQRVKLVQQHFLWHPRPVKYDIFHMILHSIWYNRVFLT